MSYVIMPRYPLSLGGEFKSIEAAVEAIRDRAGLYASSVKVEKLYKNKLGSDAAYVTFLGMRFNIREPVPEAEIETEPETESVDETEKRDRKRNKNIGRILKKSADECDFRAYGIVGNTDESPNVEDCGNRIVRLLQNYYMCNTKINPKEISFSTKGLASLALAWAAVTYELIYDDENRSWFCDASIRRYKTLFDHILKTGAYIDFSRKLTYRVKVVRINEDHRPTCSSAIDLPASFEDGIYQLKNTLL